MLDNFDIIRSIGKGGSAEVYLAKNKITSHKIALKVLKPTKDSECEKFHRYAKREVQALKHLSHTNVVKMYGCKEQLICNKATGKEEPSFMIALEHLQNSDLYEYIEKTGSFNERLARYFFTQLVNGVEHVHKSGFAHRDLKLENLLLDKEFTLKIVDFGFSTRAVEGENVLLQRILGTSYYMAPEMYSDKGYSGHHVDIFAMGVILFMLIAGHYPFHKAKLDDSLYSLLSQGHIKDFFEYHSQSMKNASRIFNSDLCTLIKGMLELDPAKRMTIKQIKQHRWYIKDSLSSEEAIKEMNLRKFMLLKKVEECNVQEHKTVINNEHKSVYCDKVAC